jgi:hypothetical protein
MHQGFRKTNPDQQQFENDQFIRGRKELLVEIQRRKKTTMGAAGRNGSGADLNVMLAGSLSTQAAGPASMGWYPPGGAHYRGGLVAGVGPSAATEVLDSSRTAAIEVHIHSSSFPGTLSSLPAHTDLSDRIQTRDKGGITNYIYFLLNHLHLASHLVSLLTLPSFLFPPRLGILARGT